MPVYEHKLTGNRAELSRDYAENGFDNVWELVEEEGPNERSARELREALANKVSLEDENGDEVTDGSVTKKLTAAQKKSAAESEQPPVAHVLDNIEGAK